MKYLSQFLLLLLAVAILLGLQYQYWFGESGHQDSTVLAGQLQTQQRLNDKQRSDNIILRADVNDLKTGLEAVEEHARLDLGLIKPHETFVQLSTAPSIYDNNQATSSNPVKPAIEPIP